MNGGRHGRMDIDGCLSSIGYGFLIMVGLGIVLASLAWFFSRPDDVCVKYERLMVIEKNQAQQEIAVNKLVCTQYAPSPQDRPFIRLYHWATSQRSHSSDQ